LELWAREDSILPSTLPESLKGQYELLGKEIPFKIDYNNLGLSILHGSRLEGLAKAVKARGN
jgi:hypothetical protein